MMENNYKCEILAPAGSFKCMVAAFNAGADAVYLGGSMFGARAYADNFHTEELIQAINYAHLRGKKLYLTVNTLIKEQELNDYLMSFLTPLYEAGLDAVIVQDLGVLSFIHKTFPTLHIHASTQMTVTGVAFAKELKRLGVTRIVVARELSLSEISSIYEATGLEIEAFVHGALCYSYSGQCLFSSLIGGRSGNRGRCAQPCRMIYDLYDSNTEKKLNIKDDKYLLSPKDLCTLDILPKVINAGVYSLKIEGRMKKPEYVAGVVSTYRKYVNYILSESNYKINVDDIEKLKEIYNRGGFCNGYFEKRNNADMMSIYKPNHYGAKVAEVIAVNKDSLVIKALKDINVSDVIEVNLKRQKSIEFQIKNKIISGDKATFRHNLKNVSEQDLYEKSVYRTRNNTLIKELVKQYIDTDTKIQIGGTVKIKQNEPIYVKVTLDLDGMTFIGEAYSSLPNMAQNRPATIETIEKQIRKTGATQFELAKLSIILDDGLFVPVSDLNEVRRNAIQDLEEKVLKHFSRSFEITNIHSALQERQKPNTRSIECIVSKPEQLEAVLEVEGIDIISIELSSFTYLQIEKVVKRIRKFDENIKIHYALPYICRDIALNDFVEHNEFFIESDYDGMLVRNYEEYFYFKEIFEKSGISKKIVLDSNIYAFNNNTIEYIESIGADMFSLPYELNGKELKNLNTIGARMEIYGYIPVMITANCVKKTNNSCDGISSCDFYLKDKLNNKFFVATNCKYCHNVIYNNKPLMLADYKNEINTLDLGCLAIRFSIEDKETSSKELRNILNIINDIENETDNNASFTRGHFKRGVM